MPSHRLAGPLPGIGLLALAVMPLPAEDLPCLRCATPPTIDGKVVEWASATTLAMSEPSYEDLKVDRACISWDAGHLLVSVVVPDSAVVNENPPGKDIFDGDCLDFRVCDGNGLVTRIGVAPTSARGKPVLYIARREKSAVDWSELVMTENPAMANLAEVAWAASKSTSGWTVELSIPFKAIAIEPTPGTAIPCVLVVWDKDGVADEWKGWHRRVESSSQKLGPEKWNRIVLKAAP